MNCENIQRELPAYYDGELPAKETATVKQHLSNCQACRQGLEEIDKIWALIGALPFVQPSADFKARFWERVRQEEEKPSLWDWLSFPSWRPILAGVAAVWVLGITSGILVYKHGANVEFGSMAAAASVFTGPYPPNSIEQIYFQGPNVGPSGRKSS